MSEESQALFARLRQAAGAGAVAAPVAEDSDRALCHGNPIDVAARRRPDRHSPIDCQEIR